MIPFRRKRGGVVAATLTNEEVELMRALTSQLGALLEPVTGFTDDDPLPGLVIGGGQEPPEDSALARLLPDAYRDDEDASSEFRRMTERGLANRKASHAVAVAASVPDDGHVELDSSAAQSWLRTLTDLRLVLAARLGIDSDEWEPSDDDQVQSMLEVYDWLAFAQESLVQALDR
jgi:hypothetical protein